MPTARPPRRPAATLALVAVLSCAPLAGAAGASAAPPAAADPRAGQVPAASSLREELTRERFYFVMADRFENGEVANDDGGYGPDRLVSGLDPSAKGFYHGGDLRGVIDRLDYIEGLGTTAIWLTPSFKNKPVQGTGAATSAGYHGYWITDFTRIDPHLGTNADLEELVDAAHARGMKVFFDIITNHTADVISYAEGSYDYVPKALGPYRTAAGEPFDDREFAGTETFPALDPQVSFPYTPVFPTPGDATAKVPAWLNDPTLYHNRGNALFNGGESDLYGDFFGLDDLFTEHPAVVDGMTEIYEAWVDFGIDGFRIDTVKHVNTEFWQDFAPAIDARAAAGGNGDFFAFGEVYDADPADLSYFTTEAQLQAVLDFGFQDRARAFGSGGSAADLQEFFALDDLYTDADSNAYSLPTFLGNHDMGRIGRFLAEDGASGDELLARDRMVHSLMYLVRGQPVVYYGDEQGFTGDGGDQDARQDMFASEVATYNDDDLIGTDATTAASNFDPQHPLYRWIAELAALRERYPALADGAQLQRYASEGPGVFAVSRIADEDDVEHLVAVNNAETAQTVTFDTASDRTTFRGVWPAGTDKVRSDGTGSVTVTVPPLSAVVWRADRPLAPTRRAAAPVFTGPVAAGVVAGRAEVGVTVPGDGLHQVTFAYRPTGAEGTAGWTVLGTDDNAPHRVFHDVGDLAEGTALEYRAVVRDHTGKVATATAPARVGPPPAPEVPPVVQPSSVTVAGDLNSEMGCAADWSPACEQARMTYDAAAGLWRLTAELPAGTWQYKIAVNASWDENYGAGGVPGGANISLTTTGGPVTFTYDHATHVVSTS